MTSSGSCHRCGERATMWTGDRWICDHHYTAEYLQDFLDVAGAKKPETYTVSFGSPTPFVTLDDSKEPRYAPPDRRFKKRRKQSR